MEDQRRRNLGTARFGCRIQAAPGKSGKRKGCERSRPFIL
jgi:hypothetical protein